MHIYFKYLRVVALLTGLTLGLLGFVSARAGILAPDFSAVDSYLETKMKEAHIPGMAIGIVQGNTIVHTQGFGTLNDAGEKVTAQTPFILGSTSKSFTALAIMQLVEAGKIELNAPVQKYIPWFRVADAQASSKITIQQLLNHSSGISIETGNQPLVENQPEDRSLEEWVKTLGTAKLSRPVGESYEYSNANYIILGLVIEKVSGQSYEEYIQKNIFMPLQMGQSFTSQEKAREHGMATGYHLPFGVPDAAMHVPYPTSFIPVGFIISSVEDMSHYLVAQLNGGKYQDHSVLSAAGVNQLHAPGVEMEKDGNLFYGMGWVNRTFNDIPVIWHDGDTGHFHTEMALIPEGQWGFVLFMNASHFRLYPAFEEMASGTTSLLMGKTPRDYINFKRIIAGIYFTIILGALLQLVWLIFAFIDLKHPKNWKTILWKIAVPVILNGAISSFFLWIGWQFIAPFWEIVSFMPDLGAALILTSVVSIGWLVRTILAFW